MQARPEIFRSSGAVVFGAISGVVSLGLAVFTALPAAGAPAWVPAALVLLTVMVYVAQVRPAVLMEESELVLRNMLQSVHLPWPAIEQVRIQQFLTVTAGGRDYTCAAVGRTRRQIRRDGPSGVPLANPGGDGKFSYGRLVESRILDRAKEARNRQGVVAESPEQAAIAEGVHVVRAWPEIVVLALAVLALVTTVLV